MQAAPISNVSPANTGATAVPTIGPSAPQPPSLFGALFQSKVKPTIDTAKSPAAEKPHDSARQPAGETTKLGAPGASFLIAQAMAQAPVSSPAPVVPNVPALTSLPKQNGAWQGPAVPAEDLLAQPSNVPQGSAGYTGATTTSAPQCNVEAPLLRASIVANPPSDAPASAPTIPAANTLPLGPSPQDLVAPAAMTQLSRQIPSTAAIARSRLSQIASTAQDLAGPGGAKQAGSQLPQGAAIPTAIPPADTFHTATPAQHLSSPSAERQAANRPLESPAIAPLNFSPISSARQNSPVEPQPLQSEATAPAPIPVTGIASPIVSAQAAQNATLADLIASLHQPDFIPHQATKSLASPVSGPLSQDIPGQHQSGPANALANGPNISNLVSTLSARTSPKLLNEQPQNTGPATANIFARILIPTASATTTQSETKLTAASTAAASETLLQEASKTAATGAPAGQGSIPPHATSPSLPAGVAPANSKPQAKDGSEGSSGGEGNAKSGHNSNSSSAAPDTQKIVQLTDFASASPHAGLVPTADPASAASAAATLRGPADLHSADANSVTSANTGAALHQMLAAPAQTENMAVVSVARLTDHSGQIEVRIEMQSDSLGSVELRAHVSGNQLGASIAVEHHAAEVMLATELPALHSALAEKNIHMDTLVVSQGTHASMGGGPGADTGQKYFAPSHVKAIHGGSSDSPLAFSETPLEWANSGETRARLSVLA